MEPLILLVAILSGVLSAVTLYKVTKLERDLAAQKEPVDPRTEDEVYKQAKAVTMQVGKISASLLQRHLKIGYARAARLLDLMEADGIIGPADGAKPREVIIKTIEE
jgi:S-DNA-T family DNA segregation ATPase FtsK/SpoIIIE